MTAQRVLVVANQTLEGEPLLEAIQVRSDRDDVTFHVVVPATIPSEGFVYTEAAARVQAARRLKHLLGRLDGRGVVATGEVGDANPMYAIGDALRAHRFDEIIISTLPAHLSKWLRQDLPRRAANEFRLPVHHVVETTVIALRNERAVASGSQAAAQHGIAKA